MDGSGISGIPDMARVWSGKTPDKAALIDTDRVVTYAQLDDRSNRIANTLIAAGIRPAPTSVIWARTPRRSSRSGSASTRRDVRSPR